MRSLIYLLTVASLVLNFATQGIADDGKDTASCGIRRAIVNSIPRLEAGMRGSADQRECFTCHSQAVPVFALALARERGFVIDDENYQRQIRHTIAHLERGRNDYLDGRGQGGRVLTAGYALWTLDAAKQAQDDTTSAVTQFLLDYQTEKVHWRQSGTRPPSSGSDFTATYVAMKSLYDYGTDPQRTGIEVRFDEVGKWLLKEEPQDTEDHVFRLLSLPYVEVSDAELEKAAAALSDLQQADGGWAQMDGMQSDAYATGTSLFALLTVKAVSVDDPVVKRGIEYLLRTQREDGTWHVPTRAKPVQVYFESGFPHGKDQFISIAASGWSTLALLLAIQDD